MLLSCCVSTLQRLQMSTCTTPVSSTHRLWLPPPPTSGLPVHQPCKQLLFPVSHDIAPGYKKLWAYWCFESWSLCVCVWVCGRGTIHADSSWAWSVVICTLKNQDLVSCGAAQVFGTCLASDLKNSNVWESPFSRFRFEKVKMQKYLSTWEYSRNVGTKMHNDIMVTNGWNHHLDLVVGSICNIRVSWYWKGPSVPQNTIQNWIAPAHHTTLGEVWWCIHLSCWDNMISSGVKTSERPEHQEIIDFRDFLWYA